ncbi:hypothetical protein K32_42290 [Kaistia sp. 32K]|uniref:hypothetical protein n=1 Tax=Kaistia sp. 32K TaxID=2795690 RepID=UPI00191690BD|nr:hypothetical protein [Kaistia sp. 32K]BCP55612.1 hypothetical protein K32_42290 [Kaistia sp. 32K]
MPAPATKDDLKSALAHLHKSIDLQTNKLTIRVALMMVAFVVIVYALAVTR